MLVELKPELKRTALDLALDEIRELRDALIEIRDATYKSAPILRVIADRALSK